MKNSVILFEIQTEKKKNFQIVTIITRKNSGLKKLFSEVCIIRILEKSRFHAKALIIPKSRRKTHAWNAVVGLFEDKEYMHVQPHACVNIRA